MSSFNGILISVTSIEERVINVTFPCLEDIMRPWEVIQDLAA